MKIETHQRIDPTLCGRAVVPEEGASQVELTTLEQMGVGNHAGRLSSPFWRFFPGGGGQPGLSQKT
jgi:hypothetical protein